MDANLSLIDLRSHLRPWLIASLGLAIALPLPVAAQTITATPDGTGTVVQQNGQTYQILGGTQAGANLFHSFQRLGLDAGAIAQFLSTSEITNILGRVTGGELSRIDGLLQVVGSGANLYLLNPAGIVFGAGARLDVPGSFTATTADRIGFAGGWFNATGTNDYGALTGNPKQFSFLQTEPGGIVNLGTLSAPGTVQLLGGTVANQGAIAGQQVTIAAVPGTSRVRLSEPGMLLSVELERDAIAASGLIRSVDMAQWLTGAAGTVENTGQIRGQTVDLMAATRVSTLDPELIITEDGYYPTVALFPEKLGDPWAVSMIDVRVDDPYALLYGGTAGTISRMVGRDRSGLDAVQTTLNRVPDPVDQLNLVTEGNQGNIWLGDTWITAANVGDYHAQLQQWGEALTPEASLLLYSCFTALGATGEAFVNAIATSTGTAIAASTNATGSANYGGDWNLEYQTQPIQPRTPFRADTLTTWDGKLATQTVTTLANTGTGSLRDIIDNVAASGDSIVFGVAGTIILDFPFVGADASSLIIEDRTLTIDGGNQITLDGNQQNSIFDLSSSNLTLQNITLQNARIVGAQSGGGVRLRNNSTLILENSQIANNTVAQQGGGIFGDATSVMTVRNSAIANNIAVGNGGGIISENTAANAVTIINSTLNNNRSNASGGGLSAQNATLINSTLSGNVATSGGGASVTNNFTVRNSTIAFNQATAAGGGIYLDNAAAVLTATNSIISQNIAPVGADLALTPAIFAQSTIESNLIGLASGAGAFSNTNLIGINPLLGPLQNNGGPTQTHALPANSPALDAGNNDLTTVTTDQLGNPRISNSRVDLGAFELQVTPTPPPAPLPSAPQPDGCPPYCEDQDAERLINPDMLTSEPSEGTSLLDPVVEELDSKVSQDYAGYYNLGEVSAPSLGEIQATLQTIAAATGQDPAVVYFTFTPIAVDDSDADVMARSLLASTRLAGLGPELAPMAAQNRSQSDELQLVVVTATGEPIFKRVRGVTRSQVLAITRRLTRSITRQDNAYWSAAQQLNEWLIAPLEADLNDRGIDNLAIIADAGLRSLPFAALYDGETFLVERYSLGLMPSVSLTNTDYQNIQNSDVLAMGASHFDGLADLPAVPLELELITTSQGGEMFLNDAFTMQNLRQHRQDYQVVHLGTHGEFQGGTAQNSFLAMGRDRITLDQIRTLGFNNPPLELLVLSACQTALGDESAELGFGGLAVQAGAKSVLGSLWYVSDAGTLGMMSQFYPQLHQAPIKAEALRQTQLAMLNGDIIFRDGTLISGDRIIPLTPQLAALGDVDFTHPFYWSAFTLIGSPW
ncbi:CHAT domain-containing protein [Spirulina major]|uniref:CHAT domain-containing protein n=1 Tax=Spirulina major TaxID=270636 RepID=UPI0009337DC6|nr:CHAT domain-containing protein [Spirulina major]